MTLARVFPAIVASLEAKHTATTAILETRLLRRAQSACRTGEISRFRLTSDESKKVNAATG